jgi:cell division septal protein FtsQ
MSTAVLDERAERRALVRAQAVAIADSPRPARRIAVGPGTQLRSSARRRRHLRQRMPVAVTRRAPSRMRRIVAITVLMVQVALLVLLFNLPVFKVHTIALSGEQLLSRAALLQAAAVPEQSIFTVDGEAIRTRLTSLPWIQSATVSTELPATVRINVVERSPTLRIRRAGVDTVFADNGASLDESLAQQARWSLLPVLLDGRVGSAQPVAPQLIAIMSTTAARLKSVLGCSVAAYEWDSSAVFSLWTTSGWRAVLGHVDTSDALAAVPAQLATLGALRDQLDLANPSFGYIDLENAAAPAVGGKPGLPPEIQALNAAS